MEPRTGPCVLCRTCANWSGRATKERRRGERLCQAGLVPSELFQCESYVRRAIRPTEQRALRESRPE